MEIKRPCGFKNKCTTLTIVDSSHDLPSMGMFMGKWCDKHMKQYKREQKILDKLVPKYNKMKIQDKFGRIIKFSHGTDVSNYLFRNGKKCELNKILKKAEK